MKITIGTHVLNAPEELQFILQRANDEARDLFAEYMVRQGEEGAGSREVGRIPVATGELLQDWRNVVKSSSTDPEALSIAFKMGFTLRRAEYMDTGRKPGRPPPVAAIIQWLTIKGITPPDMTKEQFAFAIARKMAKHGSWAYRKWGGYRFTGRLFALGEWFYRIAVTQAYNRREIPFRWVGTDVELIL